MDLFPIYRRIRSRAAGVYKAARLSKQVKIAGNTYTVPLSEPGLLSFDVSHEPWLDPVFEFALQNREGVFIDVGVNQGQTLAKVLRLSPTPRYIGFEPQCSCALFVDQFIRLNQLENCRIVPAALSDRAGVLELHQHSTLAGDSMASIARDHRPNSFYVQSTFVPSLCGDDAVQSLGIDAISTIKIDVEGAELEVLNGFRRSVHELRPFVVFEVLNNFLAATGERLSPEMEEYRNERANLISTYFHDAGYDVFNVRGKELIRRGSIVPEVSADLSITDYFGVPKELSAKVEERFSVNVQS